MSKETTIESIRNLAIEIRENNDKELWLERFIHAIYQEVVYPLIEEHNDKVANLYAKIEPLEKEINRLKEENKNAWEENRRRAREREEWKEKYSKLLDQATELKAENERLKKSKLTELEKLYNEMTERQKAEVDIAKRMERKETAEKFARDIFNHITTLEVWEKLRQLWLSKDGNFKANKHIYDLLIEPVAKQFGEIKEN